MKNCGRKFSMSARSRHCQATYIQPAAPVSCRNEFHGVIPRVWNTMAISITQALAHFTAFTFGLSCTIKTT